MQGRLFKVTPEAGKRSLWNFDVPPMIKIDWAFPSVTPRHGRPQGGIRALPLGTIQVSSARFSGFLQLTYVIWIFAACVRKKTLVCGRAEEACSMVVA